MTSKIKNKKSTSPQKLNENNKNWLKNLLFILIVVLVIGLIFFLSTRSNKENDNEIVDFRMSDFTNITAIGLYEYEASLTYEGTSIIFFCSSENKDCNTELSALNEIAKDYQISIEYLNIAELVASEKEELKNSLNIFQQKEYPHLLIIKNGEIVNNSNIYLKKSEIIDIFKKFEIIK